MKFNVEQGMKPCGFQQVKLVSNSAIIDRSWRILAGKGLMIILLVVMTIPDNFASSDRLLDDPDWVKKIKPGHPRMIFTSDDLPQLRERAYGICRDEFQELKSEVDALPDKPDLEYVERLIKRSPDGKITAATPSMRGYQMFVHDGSNQAIRAALLYLITEEKRYLEIARRYLFLYVEVLRKTAEIGVWADWQGNSRVNAILAYDWIYNQLSEKERRDFVIPMLDYITKSQPDGEFTFRRTSGGPSNGNYGEVSLQFFIGLAAHGDNIDDPVAEKMLRSGARVFVDMLDYREQVSGGSGLLSTPTANYSFGPYPYATFFFFHLWQSAFGEDVSDRWPQMADFPKWFDFSAVKILPDGQFLTLGIGDTPHTNNLTPGNQMYLHLAQIIHFYASKFPDKAADAYSVIQRIPEAARHTGRMYPFLFFSLFGFVPDEIDRKEFKQMGERSNDYFYNPTFGLLLMRSGTGEDDTYSSFRFGSKMNTHQHYDELSFVIYKNDFLAFDSGSRSNNAHHHNFAAQSVAHNTILIHEPNEPMPYFWKPWGFKPEKTTYYNHGGQNSKDKAKALALASTPDFIYAAGDATESYSKSKSRMVTRQFLYIKPDIFVIYDRVHSVKPDQKKEILFHTRNKPMPISNKSWRAENGEGVLFIHSILPTEARFNIEGGAGRDFLASGRNWELDGGEKWFEKYRTTGRWRLEVASPENRSESDFLHVLRASTTKKMVKLDSAEKIDKDTVTVSFTDEKGTEWHLTFHRTGEVGLRIHALTANGIVKFSGDIPNKIESCSKNIIPRLRD